MDKCLACDAKPTTDNYVVLYEPFDGILYCKECCEKYDIKGAQEHCKRVTDSWLY